MLGTSHLVVIDKQAVQVIKPRFSVQLLKKLRNFGCVRKSCSLEQDSLDQSERRNLRSPRLRLVDRAQPLRVDLRTQPWLESSTPTTHRHRMYVLVLICAVAATSSSKQLPLPLARPLTPRGHATAGRPHEVSTHSYPPVPSSHSCACWRYAAATRLGVRVVSIERHRHFQFNLILIAVCFRGTFSLCWSWGSLSCLLVLVHRNSLDPHALSCDHRRLFWRGGTLCRLFVCLVFFDSFCWYVNIRLWCIGLKYVAICIF